MARKHRIDELASRIASLSRDQIKPMLLGFKSRTRLDFTPEYLDSLSLDELRHVLLAAMHTLSR